VAPQGDPQKLGIKERGPKRCGQERGTKSIYPSRTDKKLKTAVNECMLENKRRGYSHKRRFKKKTLDRE